MAAEWRTTAGPVELFDNTFDKKLTNLKHDDFFYFLDSWKMEKWFSKYIFE